MHQQQSNTQRGGSMELAKDYVRHLVHSKSDRVSLVLSDTMRSAVWTCFYKIFVDGYQTSFVVCRNCGHILKYTPKDGTTAMRIHMGKFCGRMKAKAVQGAPTTPLVPTATVSGSNGLTRLTPTPNGDEPLDLQKPQLKSSILSSNNSNNSLTNGHHALAHLSAAGIDSPLTAAASAIAAAAAAISGNGSGVAASFSSSLGGNSTSGSGVGNNNNNNNGSTRPSLHGSLAHHHQMTPTAKAQEILSAFNPIPPSALPTPKMLGSFLPGHINHHNHHQQQQQQHSNANSSSASQTPTSPSAPHQVTSAFSANPLHRSQQGEAPCNLSVRKCATDLSSHGLEAVAVAFKAALATFDDDLREIDSKIADTEAQLDKLRTKRSNLLINRDHVNKAARVVLSSVNVDATTPQQNDSQPVDAMLEWIRRNAQETASAGLKRSLQQPSQDSPLSNWPQDLQMQFGRNPKRLRKALTAVRRGPNGQVLGNASAAFNGNSDAPEALANASELLNVPAALVSSSKSATGTNFSGHGENNNGEVMPSNSDGSSVANTPPSSEYLNHEEDHDEDDYMGVSLVKSENMEDIDIEDDSADEEEAHSSANGSLMIDDGVGSSSTTLVPTSLQLQQSFSMFESSAEELKITCCAVTQAFLFVGTANGCVVRYDLRTSAHQLYRPFEDEPQTISCLEAWIFGENDDDFAVLLGTDRGIFRCYNPEFSNMLCEKKLNWPITVLRVVAKRHLAFIGLKMGVMVSVDLDKMELASKTVCGFGSIVDVDWLENDMVFVATEDGTVSIRDLNGGVISSVDLTMFSPLVRIQAALSENSNEIVLIAATKHRGIVQASLLMNGQASGRPVFELCDGDSSQQVVQFGKLCPGAHFGIDATGKLTAYRFGTETGCQTMFSQEVWENQVELLVDASCFNGESCYLFSNNGLVKSFRIITTN